MLALLCLVMMSFTDWQTDFKKAKEVAKTEHRLILLNFSGSDWCGPCMRLRNEVFASGDFTKLSGSSLVLLNADFPRSRKNQLSKEAQQQNDWLAEKYNPNGRFPYTLLLDEEGRIIKAWDGFPKDQAKFIAEIKERCDAR